MKIKKTKRLLALILCMALVLGTNTFTMAAGAGQTQEESLQEQENISQEEILQEPEESSPEEAGTEAVQAQALEAEEIIEEEPQEEAQEQPQGEEIQKDSMGETEEAATEDDGQGETAETNGEENVTEELAAGETTTDTVLEEVTEEEKPTEITGTTGEAAENTGNADIEASETMNEDGTKENMEEVQEIENSEEQEWSQQVGDTLVKVKAPKGVLPEDAVLSVSEITAQEEMDKIEDAVEEKAIEEKFSIENIFAYDIKFMVGDNEVQPEGTVQVTVDTPEITSGQEASVLHLKDDTTVEDMNGAVDTEGQVVFDTTHFSTYVIVNESEDSVEVTLEHYDAATNKKIYADDKLTWDQGKKSLIMLRL